MEPDSYHLYNNIYPNPNPNPILPSSAVSSAGDGGFLRPPGLDHYLQYSARAQPLSSAPKPAPVAESYYYGAPGGDLLHQQYALTPSHSFSYGIMNTVGIANSFIDLESKKWKVIQGGASADSVRVCTICNVVCNSDKVFASHVAGEKHALKAIGVSALALKPKVPAHLKALLSANKAIRPTPKSAAKTAAKSFVTFVQSSYCDVCKIDCNSQEVLNNHKMGKKHMKNMQKLQASITPNPATAPVKNVIQKDASVAGQAKAVAALPTKEDLETKKQKVLHGGASAAAVRVCDLCNVVCNSKTVFNSHIAGQKHMSMVNKK